MEDYCSSRCDTCGNTECSSKDSENILLILIPDRLKRKCIKYKPLSDEKSSDNVLEVKANE